MSEKIPNTAKKFRYVQPVYNGEMVSGWMASNKESMEGSVYIQPAGKGFEYVSLNDLW